MADISNNRSFEGDYTRPQFTTTGCRVPLDVVDLVMTQLASIGSFWALRQCSLVCKDFAAICQKRLFTDIVLCKAGGLEGSHRRFSALASFTKALENKPYLEGYVRVLNYSHDLDRRRRWPAIFRRLRHVRSLHIRMSPMGGISWRSSRIIPSFKSSFQRFIQSNQIIQLNLCDMYDLPTHIFALLPCLEVLGMSRITLDNDPLFVQKNPPKLHSLIVSVGAEQPVNIFMADQYGIVDLRALKHLDIRLGRTAVMTRVMKRLIQQSEALESLKFEGALPCHGMRHTLTGLLPNKSLKSLRSIELFTELVKPEDDPYLNLTSELEKLSGINVLEDLTLSIMVQLWSTCNTETSRWSELDRVLSQPSAFPRLRDVKITVSITWYRESYRNKEMEARLAVICGQAFPSLKGNEKVKFDITLDISQIDSKEVLHMTF